MKFRHLVRAAVLIALLGAVFPLIPRGGDGQAAPLVEPEVRQWTFGSTAGPLVAGTQYSLRNETNGKYLGYKEREYGINLDWRTNAVRNVRLFVRGRSTREIRPGEDLALYVAGGGYVYYKEREYGINLEFSTAPHYEWELAEVHSDRPFGTGQKLALYNTAHGDYAIYAYRNYGVNLRWWGDVVPSGAPGYTLYPPLPFPQHMRGAGETGQIIVKGTAKTVKVFHGRVADELDWHVYIRPDEDTRQALVTHLQEHAERGGDVKDGDLKEIYSEWMVLDGIAGGGTFNYDVFYSADVTRALALVNSAWSEGVEAARHEGSSEVAHSRLNGFEATVYLQGAFVNDSAHHMLPEIHPLDSLAYLVDEEGNPVNRKTAWPKRKLTWRVAAFSNSTVHRIKDADYLEKPRLTVWYLPIPTQAGGRSPVTTVHHDFDNHAQRVGKKLDDRRRTIADRYTDYGVLGSGAKIVIDPADGRWKLRVSVLMKQPDAWGGMFLADYTIKA